MSIEENVEKVLEEIAAAARAAGRKPGEVTLCAATKMNDAQAVRRAIAAGVRICGENRVQELTAKLADISSVWALCLFETAPFAFSQAAFRETTPFASCKITDTVCCIRLSLCFQIHIVGNFCFLLLF